jgi:hypothetical protein
MKTTKIIKGESSMTEAQKVMLEELKETKVLEAQRKLAQRIVGIRITTIERTLGMSPNDPDVYREYIASKAPDAPSVEEEVAAVGVDQVVKEGMTIFPKNDDGTPFFWNYQIKGSFKDKCGMLARVGKNSDDAPAKKDAPTLSGRMTAYKKNIDGLIFPYPRRIPITLPEGGEIGSLERPLRAQTAQGERIALANSETIPPLSVIEFEVILLDAGLYDVLMEWMDYGALHGLGQWRNAGWGAFTYEVTYDRNADGTDYVPAKRVVKEKAPVKKATKA